MNIFIHWRIHLIFIVVQFDFVLSLDKNSFNRTRFDYSNSVFVENNIIRVKSIKIERLLNKRETTRHDSKYLIRWKDYKFQYNEWKNLSELNNIMNLIQKYEEIIQIDIYLFDRLKISFVDLSQKQTSSRKKRLTLFFIVSSQQKKLFASSKKIIFVVTSIRKKISDDIIIILSNRIVLRKFFTFFITSIK